MIKIFCLLMLSTYLLMGDDAHMIMQKVDENMRGQNIYMKITMKITAMGHTRTMKMESWAKGPKKSFVKVTYPPKERGITFLSLENQMWQYVPKIERVIKIPPSMMLQNWMGSDITNDDMVKQSSIVEDYEPTILKKEGEMVMMQLLPKEEAAVVWGKIISYIDLRTYTSQKDIFYDEEGEVVRHFIYRDVKKFGKYYMATYWKVEPLERPGHFTEITLEKVQYDSKVSDQYFRKSALKRFSR